MSDAPAPLVITVSKADPTGKEPTAGAVLQITADLPKLKGEHPYALWRALNFSQHIRDAQQIVTALAALPQGTIDQVLLLLLQQRASLLRVAGPVPSTCLPEAAPIQPHGTEAPAEEPPTAQVVDLMEALKASLAGAKPRKESE